ncbi:aminoglycoside phosphotransferase family protein [Miltoncostaea oceani]|uniref:aminoglycoside phosphotransferase family protein n=1 Tax=Miltoncostaea oceani TaxID=2843216 RepID=UPI001C3DB0A5|nr:aminoglycoside phosphotransferase family protein [Miltoncostaea oceani]
MTRRFVLHDRPGPEPRIVKTGDPAALAREAEALRRLAGVAWAPPLVEAGPGRIVSGRLPGEPRDLSRGVDDAGARRLGGVLADLHGRDRADRGGLWWWDAPARSPAAHRARRAADAAASLAGTPHAGLVERALRRPLPAVTDREPFRMVHGDLVAANIVWGPAGPALVDWEFWRMGDPAEDVAYLIAVNGLPPPAAAAVLDGYGDPGMPPRVAAWTALVALDAAGWYLARGLDADAAPLLDRARRDLDAP